MHPVKSVLILTGLSLGLASGVAWGDDGTSAPFESLEAWGEALFFDTDLSANRTQSCASCHDPDFAFTDPREGPAGRAVSLGDDGVSLGDRNAPTATYARFSPAFHAAGEGIYKGGQFHDGRAATLADQAKGPPLNPIEMGMPDARAVAERLWEKPRYRATLQALAGDAALGDADLAFDTMARAIGAFEETDLFAPFDSKYDRFLRGEARFTDQEELGRLLFFSEQFTNCNICHQLQPGPIAPDETFSNYEYHNIGVPANPAARAANGVGDLHRDRGLLDNPDISDPTQAGKFKVPTLRNVAVTGPYMHNGVFEDLRSVIVFYNKYNSRLDESQINPETGQPFGPPEIAENISLSDLEHGPALDDFAIDAIVAFLETLTDARYEHLLED
ncbi:cytochrome-c peroxidase [Pseudothioclava nitratireducens]|uniref:cytochrome-c peroxidase n=1 Tax=Pseudothioclava nitratireducens TaxID=1928646 RepID=UPI0023DC8C87|nr:cytochrome c peroxidase [Defluviimonas nitratireducens]MDF1620224.1 cytochrome c peroxidase [Defluviimonas nitratireducens]